MILYTSLCPWGKEEIKSTLVGYFLLSTIAVVFIHWKGGLITGEVVSWFYAGYPALVAGVIAGSLLFDKVDSSLYRRVLTVCLVILGLFMLGKVLAVSL